MKFPCTAACLLFLAACSSTPVETTAKAKPEPQPRTGRAGIQSTFPTARGWAPDAELLTARGLHLNSRAASEGRFYAWEVTFVSASHASSRTFIWSAVEAEGLNEGVFGGPPQSWRAGSQPTVQINAIKVDTSDALAAATAEAKSFLAKPGDKPPVTFMLEMVPRFNAPAWRVMWGLTPGSSEFTVFVHAETGKVLGQA